MLQLSLFYIASILMIGPSLWAGDLQGGGGGKINSTVRQFLDKRYYGLDGAAKQVAPGVHLTNACLDRQRLHTIEPIWQCSDASDRVYSLDKWAHSQQIKCPRKQKVKKHKAFEVPEKTRVCLKTSAQIISGQVKNVCVQFADDRYEGFQKTYKLDVYRLSLGTSDRAIRPKIDEDIFVRTIDYTIPSCLELNIN